MLLGSDRNFLLIIIRDEEIYVILVCCLVYLNWNWFLVFCQGFQPPVLIFVQSKDRAKDLFHELFYDKANVEVIHGDKTQAQVRGIAN